MTVSKVIVFLLQDLCKNTTQLLDLKTYLKSVKIASLYLGHINTLNVGINTCRDYPK